MHAINATIRAQGVPTVKLEQATLEQIEAAAAPTQPFNDELRARIAELAGDGKRVHLMECPATRYITGGRVYSAFASSKAAFGWSIGQASAV